MGQRCCKPQPDVKPIENNNSGRPRKPAKKPEPKPPVEKNPMVLAIIEKINGRLSQEYVWNIYKKVKVLGSGSFGEVSLVTKLSESS